MTSTKNPPISIFLALIFGLIFGTPLAYKALTLHQELSVYDTQELSSDIQVGDEIKTLLKIEEDFKTDIHRISYYYFWKSYRRRDSIVSYSNISPMIRVSDLNDLPLNLETSNQKVFTEILASMWPSETTDSLQLVTAFERNTGEYVFHKIKSWKGRPTLGRLVDSATIEQFNLWHYKERIAYEEWPVTKDYAELLAGKAPAVLYNRQKETKGKLIFGRFEIKNTAPLEVRCIEFISDETPEALKKRIWKHSFRSFNLAIWIACGLLFCVSMFLLINLFIRLIKGKPID